MAYDVLTQRERWEIFDRCIASEEAVFAKEPVAIESALRVNKGLSSPSPKAWADIYLAAFAVTAGLALVTFDRALAGKVDGAILLS